LGPVIDGSGIGASLDHQNARTIVKSGGGVEADTADIGATANTASATGCIGSSTEVGRNGRGATNDAMDARAIVYERETVVVESVGIGATSVVAGAIVRVGPR
jgi:hypothetical protein